MTPQTAAVFLVALGLAALDVALPLGPAPRPLRRALRAAPAAVLALGARLQDAPALVGLTLALFALADALDSARTPAFATGELAVACIAALVLAALVFEMGSAPRLFSEPWRLLPGVAAAVAGAVLVGTRPRLRDGPVGSVVPLLPSAAALAVLVAGALPGVLWEVGAAAGLYALLVGWRLLARRRGGPSRWERAASSAAALALAAAFLAPTPFAGG